MKKSHLLNSSLVALLVLLSLTECRAQDDYQRLVREQSRQAVPYTKRLPVVDKVELIKIAEHGEDGRIISIGGTKIIEGREARQIAAVWRMQTWDYRESGMCHQPPFAVKFYARGKLLLYASICWECHNIVIIEPVNGGQGFHPRNWRGQKLLGLFRAAFPETGK